MSPTTESSDLLGSCLIFYSLPYTCHIPCSSFLERHRKASLAVCLVSPDECTEGKVKQKQVTEISGFSSMTFAEMAT